MNNGEARAYVRAGLLDDDGTRWSDDEVNDALTRAMDSCQSEYVRAGGTSFSGVSSLTSNTSGIVSLVTREVHSVQVVDGDNVYPLERVSKDDFYRADTVARSVKVRHTQRISPTFSSGDPFGLLSGLPFDWPAFERWVCLRAAKDLALKDGERLLAHEVEHEAAGREVMSSLSVPRARKPHRRRRRRRTLGYFHDHDGQDVVIVQVFPGVAGVWGY